MNTDESQKQINIDDTTITYNQCSTERLQTSPQMLNEYLLFFQINQPSFLKQKQIALIKSLNRQIQYIKGQQHNNFAIRPIKKTKDSCIIEFEVILRNFMFKKISVIHVNSDSPNHILSENCNGNYSNVYCCHYRGHPIAFKCFSKPTILNDKYDEIYSKFLKSIIRQYCILKLCSTLRIGPQLQQNVLGYDIAIYNDCIQFAMQYCPETAQNFDIQSIKTDLMHNLLTLHSLQIIHHDIKLDNTRYSNKFGKYVFIDFGLSRIIRQPLGFKTYTCFRGSLNFVSEEMMQLFQQSTSQKIDLYYNDLFALKSLLREAREQNEELQLKPSFIPQNTKKGRGFDKSHLLNLVKVKLFNRSLMLIGYGMLIICYQQCENISLEYLLSNFNEVELQQILNFISSSNYSRIQKDLSQKLFAVMKANFISVLPNYIQKYRYKKEQQRPNINISECFHLMNKYESIEYYLQGYPHKMGEIIHILLDQQLVIKMDRMKYFTLLSKLLQIESQSPKLTQLDKICQIALGQYRNSLFQPHINKYLLQDQSHIHQIVIYLLYTSLDKLNHRRWFDIFIRILLRAFITKIVDYFAIIQIYKILLAYKMPFIQKAKALLKFQQSLIWLYYLQIQYKKFDEMKQSITNYTKQYSNSSSYFGKQQKLIINIIIGTQQNNHQQFTQLMLQSNKYWSFDEQFCLELKLWIVYQQMSLFSYRGYLLESLQEIQSQLSYDNIFRYYHFACLLYYLHTRQFTHIEYLLGKFKQILQFLPANKFSFPFLIKCSFDLRLSQYTRIEKYLDKIKQATLQQNPKMINLIQSELDRILFEHYPNLIKCCDQHKNTLFTLQLKLQNKKKSNYEQNIERRISRLLSYILKQSTLKDQYSIVFKKFMNIDYTVFPRLSQNHLALQISCIKLEQSDKNIIYLRIMKISLYMSLFISRKKFKLVYQLCEILFRLLKCYSRSKLKMTDYLQFTLKYVFDEQRTKEYPKYSSLYHIFLQQYYNLLNEQRRQQRYFQTFIILIEILTMFYNRQNIDTIIYLYSNLSMKLKQLNNRFNTQRYMSTVQLLFVKNQNNIAFRKCNIALIDRLSLKDNPYNIIIYVGLLLHLYPDYFTPNKYKQLFWAIHICNSFIKEIYLQKLYIFYQQRFREQMPARKLKQIKRSILYNNAPGIFKIEKKQAFFLLVKPQNAKKSVKMNAFRMKTHFLVKNIGDNEEKYMSVLRFRSRRQKKRYIPYN